MSFSLILPRWSRKTPTQRTKEEEQAKTAVKGPEPAQRPLGFCTLKPVRTETTDWTKKQRKAANRCCIYILTDDYHNTHHLPSWPPSPPLPPTHAHQDAANDSQIRHYKKYMSNIQYHYQQNKHIMPPPPAASALCCSDQPGGSVPSAPSLAFALWTFTLDITELIPRH